MRKVLGGIQCNELREKGSCGESAVHEHEHTKNQSKSEPSYGMHITQEEVAFQIIIFFKVQFDELQQGIVVSFQQAISYKVICARTRFSDTDASKVWARKEF